MLRYLVTKPWTIQKAGRLIPLKGKIVSVIDRDAGIVWLDCPSEAIDFQVAEEDLTAHAEPCESPSESRS